MPWPVPSAKTIAERFAGTVETTIAAIRPAVDPLALSRAVRSARGMLAMIGRAAALEIREVHDHIAWWSRQYFPDTAEEEFADRHASIWGVARRPATVAIGTVLIEGIAETALPAGLELSVSDGVILVTTAAVEISVGGTVSVAVAAAQAGASGNVEAGIRLRTVTPFPEITKVTVEEPGMAGGAAEETAAELTAATLAHIRQRPHGGAGFDYPAWLRAEFDVRAVAVVTDWIGRGSVGVIVAMKEDDFGRAPTVEEQAAMLAFLGTPGSSSGVRPVTAHVVLVPAEIAPIDITVRIRPDTVATRAAVSEAFTRFLATIGDEEDDQNSGPIGARIEPSRISEAISAASGEYAHDLIIPAAPFTLDADQYPEPGVITFADPA